MNRSVLSDCVHKEQHSDGVISELISFLHKSLPEHDSCELISFASNCVYKQQYRDKVISQMINFLHKSLPEHDSDE